MTDSQTTAFVYGHFLKQYSKIQMHTYCILRETESFVIMRFARRRNVQFRNKPLALNTITFI